MPWIGKEELAGHQGTGQGWPEWQVGILKGPGPVAIYYVVTGAFQYFSNWYSCRSHALQLNVSAGCRWQ